MKLESIAVKGIKCLKLNEFPLVNLNLLAGANASGKSSFIQSILLLRQSFKNTNLESLDLSGPLYEAGMPIDILHPESEHKVEVDIKYDGERICRFSFEYDRSVDRIGQSSRAIPTAKKEWNFDLKLANIFNDKFIYLNAERVSPKLFYCLPRTIGDMSGVLGAQGQYTSFILAHAAINNIQIPHFDSVSSLINKAASELDAVFLKERLDNTGGRLDLVVDVILSWLIPGAHFNVSTNDDTDTSSLRFIRDSANTKVEVRPTHIGFGLTYALPIITAALIQEPSSLTIIENPEAHLHPFSQSRFGVFLALMSSFGKQFIVETHSDHLINGVRISLAKGLVDKSYIFTHFFDSPEDGTTATVIQVEFDETGSLDKWPKGFFDQIEEDLSKLI